MAEPQAPIQCVGTCEVTVQHQVTLEAPNFVDLGISAQAMLKVYAWGFGAVFGMFLVGYVLGIALGLIKKA